MGANGLSHAFGDKWFGMHNTPEQVRICAPLLCNHANHSQVDCARSSWHLGTASESTLPPKEHSRNQEATVTGMNFQTARRARTLIQMQKKAVTSADKHAELFLLFGFWCDALRARTQAPPRPGVPKTTRIPRATAHSTTPRLQKPKRLNAELKTCCVTGNGPLQMCPTAEPH